MGYDCGDAIVKGTINIDLKSKIIHVEASSGMVIIHTDRSELQQIQFMPSQAKALAQSLLRAVDYYDN